MNLAAQSIPFFFFYIDSWSLILMFITYASNYRLQPNRSDWPRWSMTRTMQILRIKWNRYKKLLSFRIKLCFNSSLNPNDVQICSQLMEVTGKNQDDCMVALHDCNEDVNRAINFLLEGTSDAVKIPSIRCSCGLDYLVGTKTHDEILKNGNWFYWKCHYCQLFCGRPLKAEQWFV